MARAWAELMNRLGYTRYVAQGGDWGAFVVDQMGLQAPAGLLAIHTNMPATVPADVDKALLAGAPPPSGLSADERAPTISWNFHSTSRSATPRMMASRPQTLYGIADSPVGLAAWLLDHNDADGQPAAAVASALNRTTSATGELTRDEILDNITLYWLTNTGVSASRLYWEYKGGFFNAKGVSIPVAVSVFPGEQYEAPRTWTERAYPNLIYYNKLDKGGHFAAWEQPELFRARFVPRSGRSANRPEWASCRAVRASRAHRPEYRMRSLHLEPRPLTAQTLWRRKTETAQFWTADKGTCKSVRRSGIGDRAASSGSRMRTANAYIDIAHPAQRSSPLPPLWCGEPVCGRAATPESASTLPGPRPWKSSSSISAAASRRRVGPSKEPVNDRSQGVQLAHAPGAGALLGDGLRLAQGRGEAQRPAAVHDRDRRSGHSLHPRPLAVTRTRCR